MNKKNMLGKDSWDFIDYCNAYLIENELFFEDFERVLLPTLPRGIGNRQAFKNFRTKLVNNPRSPSNRVKIDSLERLNSVVTLQEQKQRTVTLENDIFDYKTKIDESIAEFINKLYDFNFEFNQQNEEVNNKLNLILDEIVLIKTSIQNIESDKNVLKKILQDLDSKLNKSIDLLTVLTENIKNEFSNLLKEIKNLFNSSNQLVKDLADTLTNLIKNNFTKLNNLIIEKFTDLNLNIDSIISITNSIYELVNKLFKKFKLFDFDKLENLLINNKIEIINNIKNCKSSVITNSDEAHVVTRTELTTVITTASGEIVGAVATSTATLTDLVSIEIGGLAAVVESQYLNLINSINDGFLTLKTNLNNLQHLILNNFNAIERRLNNFIDNFKSNVNDVLNKWYKKNKKLLYGELVEQICCNIVGESYIKYDGENLYMPTLIFKYKNKNNNEKRRYSQIKLRLNLKPEDITDGVVDDLKIKIQSISNFTYNFGNLRCVYVSEKRLFKTTLFTTSKEDIVKLFDKIIPITKTKFLQENISYTENSKRNYNIRKNQPLKNTNLNKFEKFYSQEMILNAVFLQVNGLDRQIKLY